MTAKQFMELIVKGIKGHDSSIVSKISKRRGRKRFILSETFDSNGLEPVYYSCLNKRDKKYLDKILVLGSGDGQNTSGESKPEDPTEMFQEFSNDWPKSGQKYLQAIGRLLKDNDLTQADIEEEELSEKSVSQAKKSDKPRIRSKKSKINCSRSNLEQITNPHNSASGKRKGRH